MSSEEERIGKIEGNGVVGAISKDTLPNWRAVEVSFVVLFTLCRVKGSFWP